MEWISVEDKLPNKNVEVLGWRPRKKEIITCFLDENNVWMYDQYYKLCTVLITHWMPLPEPPKKD